MIGFMPSIYPDELVYSWFCRYFVHSGYATNKMALNDLLYNRHCNPSKEFIGHLTPDMEQQIRGIYPMRKLILDHTMFPQYARFIECSKKKNAIYHLEHDFCDAHHLFAILPRSGGDCFLKYCPFCAAEDRNLYGEAYWHRKHQIRNMNVCPKHGVRLVNSSVSAKSEHTFTLDPAETAIQDIQAEFAADSSELEYAAYMEKIFDVPVDFENNIPIGAVLYFGMEGTKYMSKTCRIGNTKLLADDMQGFFSKIGLADIASYYQIQRTLLGSRSDFFVVSQMAFFLGMPVNYFTLADMKGLLRETDEWLRHKIRAIYWKQWKKVKTKFRELKRLGVEEEKAWICANMRNGNWYCGGYFVLQTAFNNKKLRELGYPTFTEFYLKVCEN